MSQHTPYASSLPSSGTQAGKPPRYLAVGHLTVDLADAQATEGTAGGTVLFAAATAARLGCRAAVATSSVARPAARIVLHKVDFLGDFSPLGNTPPTPETVFAHRYAADGSRRQILLRRAPRVPAAAIGPSWLEVDILHLAPVLDEVDAATVAAVRAGFVGLTAQGFLREARVGRPVHPKVPAIPAALLARTQGIVVSTEDIAAAPDWPRAVARPGRWVAVTDGPRGAELFVDGRRLHQPAFPARSVDPTGAGDIFAAALFVQMAGGASPESALRFAAAAGAWSVAFRSDDPRVIPSLEDVHSVLARVEDGGAHES